MNQVVVVDHGIGNLKSVQRGLEKVGATVEITSESKKIESASRLILPGVGAFEDGMRGLLDAGVIQAISAFIKSGNPLLGICLGMQMLFERSEENGIHEGLGFISGSVQAIPSRKDQITVRKVPHIGWNTLKKPESGIWENTLLSNSTENTSVYFVHSYMAVPQDQSHLVAVCDYEGLSITAAVKKDNISGFQFHPEKSGEAGLKILDNFVHCE
jgi:imidazole glycerol-phosphate synthase subunit HisH